MSLIPIVVILREEALPLLHAHTDLCSDLLEGCADAKARNGWTDEAIVAGSLLAHALGLF